MKTKKIAEIDFQPLKSFRLILNELFKEFPVEHIDADTVGDLQIMTDLTIDSMDSLFWFKINNRPNWKHTTLGIQVSGDCDTILLDFIFAINEKEYVSIMADEVPLNYLDNFFFVKKLKKYLLKPFAMKEKIEFGTPQYDDIINEVKIWVGKNISEVKLEKSYSTGVF